MNFLYRESDKNDTKEIETSSAPNLIFIDNNRTDKKKKKPKK